LKRGTSACTMTARAATGRSAMTTAQKGMAAAGDIINRTPVKMGF
ncbi:MAG: hypothetical protein HZB83_07450, partial [Deltaproteobacteria bacterium]|nr:hypothetical protein [Deltaproteobacteria bacterium]